MRIVRQGEQKRQPEMAFETERLLLRNWRLQDLADFTELFTDREVMLAAGARFCRTPQESLQRLREFMDNREAFAMVLKEEGKVIGSIKLQNDIRRWQVRSRSVGYELNRAYWDKGYMTEALSAMVRAAFEVYGLSVLGIGHFAGNERSQRVIERCGFRYEGTIRQAFQRFDGAVFDDVAYSITREEYEELKNKNNS